MTPADKSTQRSQTPTSRSSSPQDSRNVSPQDDDLTVEVILPGEPGYEEARAARLAEEGAKKT
jgi:hypothetical protein